MILLFIKGGGGGDKYGNFVESQLTLVVEGGDDGGREGVVLARFGVKVEDVAQDEEGDPRIGRLRIGHPLDEGLVLHHLRRQQQLHSR